MKEKFKLPRWRLVERFRLKYPEDKPDRCSICNTKIWRLYFILDSDKFQDRDDAVLVGSECCKKLTGYLPARLVSVYAEAQAEIQAEKDEMERAVEQAAFAKKWLLANPDIIEGLQALSEGQIHHWPLAEDFLEKIVKYGTLTEKQTNFVKVMMKKELISLQRYNETWAKAADLSYPVRLSYYDKDFIFSITEKALEFGFTTRQADAIDRLYHKYRKQISNLEHRFFHN